MGGKMNVEVITSFDQRYYDLIGNRCVSSWLEHWPHDMTLTCYVEDMHFDQQDRTRQVNFDQLGPRYLEFQNTALKGRVHTFAKKAFSVIHAMHHSQADRIMWLDADVITLQPIARTLLERVMPDHVASTHMGVTYTTNERGDTGSWFVPETGVFILNTQHPQFAAFRAEYTRRYHDQDFRGLRRSYDNDVYGAAITELGIASFDLCAALDKPYKTPLRHTMLGPYLHHYKAKHSKDWFAQVTDQ